MTVVPRAETTHALRVMADKIEAAPYEHKPYGESIYRWRVANLQAEILREQEPQVQGAILAEAFATRRDFADSLRDIQDLAQADTTRKRLVWANEQIAMKDLSFALVGDLEAIKQALHAVRLD